MRWIFRFVRIQMKAHATARELHDAKVYKDFVEFLMESKSQGIRVAGGTFSDGRELFVCLAPEECHPEPE